MTREEFIKEAKEYGYDDDGIKDLLLTYTEMKELDQNADYADVVLVQQAVY